MENNIDFTYAEKQLILGVKTLLVGNFQKFDMNYFLQMVTALQFKFPIESVENYHVFNFIVELFYKMKIYGLIDITEKELSKREMFNRKDCISQKDMQDLFLTYIVLSPVETFNADLGELEI